MKRPIDLQREGAMFMNVGAPDDLSAITAMVVIGNKMYVVKANSIYEVRLADEIDPDRTNPSVPNTQQKILSVGSDSEVVGRILLTARALFSKNYLPHSIDCDEALRLSFEILKDIVAMGEIREALKEDEQNSIAQIKDNRKDDRSVLLPSIKNLSQRCNEFIQKADHSLVRLYSIVEIFYPKVRKPYFEGFQNTLIASYGADDPFVRGVGNVLPFLKFVRDTRNSVEHPKQDQKIIVKDFSFDPTGSVLAPTIEIVHARSPHEAINISAFMLQINSAIVDIVESMFSGVCSKLVTVTTGLQFEVVALPEDMRREQFVRYSYGLIDQDGKIIPTS
jgi:hypothetical protein